MYSRSNIIDMVRDHRKYSQAIVLRKAGKSIRHIAKILKISTSTASIWCRNIKLTAVQKKHLALAGTNIELLRSYAKKRHLDKLNRHEKIFADSAKEIPKLNKDNLFLLGLALYWAEGFKSKSEQTVGFCNSDPRMIKFIMRWFRNSLKIKDPDFILRTEFNLSHSARKQEIEEYWSKIANIPLSQFNKPYLKESIQKRDYSKKGLYFGILRVRIRKSSELLVKIRGWIEGLNKF